MWSNVKPIFLDMTLQASIKSIDMYSVYPQQHDIKFITSIKNKINKHKCVVLAHGFGKLRTSKILILFVFCCMFAFA